MKHKKLTVFLLVLIFGAAIAGGLYLKQNSQSIQVTSNTDTTDTTDVTLNFYNTWLQAKLGTSSNLVNVVQESPYLTDELKNKLKTNLSTNPDPILCLTILPPKIGAKTIFTLPDSAQFMVVGRSGSTTTERALVTLTRQKSGWKIKTIDCLQGESAPKSEFTFEQRGALLKKVPEPLDSNYWHLIFEENNEAGHFVALTFTASSTCTYADGHEAVCDTSLLQETQGALVQGDATETGVIVRFLKLY